MDRKIDHKLVEWAESAYRKPLLLRGARQTGKTYAIRKLGRKFDRYIEVDLEKELTARRLFQGDLDSKRIAREIGAIKNCTIQPGKTLLFLDEIQACPRAVTALRYFYEDYPQLHVIAAGSLLEFALGTISMPVGRIEYLYVQPLAFQEFLTVSDGRSLAAAISDSGPDNPLSPVLHEHALKRLRDYLFLGGMPGVLARYLETGSITGAIAEQQSIIATYRDDFSKYAGRIDCDRIAVVFDALPRTIGRKVVYSELCADYRPQQIRAAIDVLEKASVIKKIRCTSGAGLPLAAGASEKHFKVLFLDVGLLQCMVGSTYESWISADNVLDMLEGAVAEQFVGQELVSLNQHHGWHGLYYWHRTARNSQAELDYLTSSNGKIIPVEVKAGASGRLRSMMIFLQAHPHVPVGARVSQRQYEKTGKIISIPLYACEKLQGIPASPR